MTLPSLPDLLEVACERTEGHVHSYLDLAVSELETDRISDMSRIHANISTALTLAKHDGYPEQTIAVLRAAKERAGGGDLSRIPISSLPHELVEDTYAIH